MCYEPYQNASVLVTGGTGSIGSIVVKQLLEQGVSKVGIYSRDETLQWELSRSIDDTRVDFIIGDVRDKSRLRDVMSGYSIVIHAAAMKHVPACEKNVWEAIAINVIGAQNVREAAIDAGVNRVVVVSTDKAAEPSGIMGMTKHLQERLFLDSSMGTTEVVVTRFGNVLGSRGSVVWTFLKQAKLGHKITLTNPDMKRFVMTPQDAANLVVWAGAYARDKTIIVKQMPACTVFDLAVTIAGDSIPFEVIGNRPGEKDEEILFNNSEWPRSYFCHSAIGDLGVVTRLEPLPHAYDMKALFAIDRKILTVMEIRDMLIVAGVLNE